MFSLRNKKDISSFRMKKVPYLLLCVWNGILLLLQFFHYLFIIVIIFIMCTNAHTYICMCIIFMDILRVRIPEFVSVCPHVSHVLLSCLRFCQETRFIYSEYNVAFWVNISSGNILKYLS